MVIESISAIFQGILLTTKTGDSLQTKDILIDIYNKKHFGGTCHSVSGLYVPVRTREIGKVSEKQN